MPAPNSLLQERYRIERLIGHGAMGAVYQATDLRLGSTVAVKQIMVADERLRTAFEREARLLASLRHPALPRVSDHFSDDDGQFLVMEFFAGADLGELLLRNGGPFAPDDVLRWADQLLDALAYLHGQQPPIMHRDIKPQNLKVTSSGGIVLLDFGLAKGTGGHTSTDSLVGYTLQYAPPEQIRGEGADPRGDLYALAATLYDLLTGVKPPDALRRLTEVLHGRPDPLRPAHDHNPQVSPAVAMVLHSAMALDPNQRPASASAMRLALHRSGSDQATVAAPQEPHVPPAHTTSTAGDSPPSGVSRSPRPTGTITLLFTDIEGSTRLWELHKEAMQAALVRHDALLRNVVEGHDGTVFKTVGDAFCAAFATAPDALDAAVAGQRALHAEPWAETGLPQGAILRVRMALHSGAVEERDGDYFGPPLNRVARLLSTGHGGQILLSRVAQELVRDHLPPGAELRDLGERRLKDLTRPEHIFQLVIPDLPADFPPLKTLDTRPNNLPAQPTPLIGREKEIDAVLRIIRRADVRLLTLTGPGGTGKTRLGLQAAAELLDTFADGVFFVSLVPIRDPDLVVATIAQALGVRETGGQRLVESLKAHLKHKQILLLLDNFEQVAAAAPLVAELLAAAPRLKLLVTSREVLHIYGERDFPVPPLALPDPRHIPPVARLTQYEAVRLFIERAQAARTDFQVTNANAPAVAEICVRLDGLPLAIELAAARTRLLPPQALLERLTSRLRLLTGGARNLPARQQTLRGTIDWSYDLLDAGEQTLFARLAVFVGGRTLEAAEAVCNAAGDLPIEVLDGLQSLIDKSLLYQTEGADGAARFMMLETIWEYALERLQASGETEALRRQHAKYYLELAEQAEAELKGPRQAAWMERLEEELDNLRAVLRWANESGVAAQGLRLGGVLWRFWEIHGHLSEGRERLTKILALPGASGHTEARAKALGAAGILAHYQGDLATARSLYEECLAIWRELGREQGIANMLNNLGIIARDQGDFAIARSLQEECLAIERTRDDQSGIAGSFMNLGDIAYYQGDLAAARALYEECLVIGRKLGDTRSIAGSLMNLGGVAYDQGDYAAVRSFAEKSLVIQREMGDRWGIACSLNLLGDVAREQGNYDESWSLNRESLTIMQELGDRRVIAPLLESFAVLAVAQLQPESAARLAGAAGELRETISVPLPPVKQAALERALNAARASLSEAAFTAAWVAGRAMTLDQAIAYALEKE